MVSDPVGSSFVASLSRPGGNVTGFTAIEGSLGDKWVELLKEIAPQVARVALLFNPAMATYAEYYLQSVVTTQAREPNGGLIIMPDAFIIGHRAEITSLTARYRVPAVYWSRFFAELGGLISYGPNGVAFSRVRKRVSFPSRRLSSSSL
jgi:putative ABC transport system substrate-binding protein